MNDSFSTAEVRFDNYDLYRSDRDVAISNKTRGGGVVIAVHSRLKSKLISIVPPTFSYDHLFVSLQIHNETFLLGCTYIPPSSSSEVYLDHCAVVEQLCLSLPDARVYLVPLCTPSTQMCLRLLIGLILGSSSRS